LLGPGRAPRNIEVIARPYPLRSSTEPTLLFFDSESKYASIILSGPVLKDVPTVVYVPYHYHYSPSFRVWATSNKIEWDKTNQLLSWYPETDENENQMIIGVTGYSREKRSTQESTGPGRQEQIYKRFFMSTGMSNLDTRTIVR
jgi:hypothetical protein